MVKKCVRIYIEGGAEGKKADNDFRRGWKKFLIQLHDLARANGYFSLEIVRGEGRADAYRRFKKYKIKHPIDLCVLLVDSETAVPNGTLVWDVVKNRVGDKWQRPSWAAENHLYLIVPFVETWLVTDRDALQSFFKRGFNPKPLPTTNLETRSKNEIEQALNNATKSSLKGAYKYGQAHEIIELVSPDKVKTLHHGERLFETLGRMIQGVI